MQFLLDASALPHPKKLNSDFGYNILTIIFKIRFPEKLATKFVEIFRFAFYIYT